jgi:hypothetical protein
MNSTLNCRVRFAIHFYFFSDHIELFKVVSREHHCNRNIGGIPASGDNNAANSGLIEDYLALTGHRTDVQGALFRPVKNNRIGRLDRHLDPASVYRNIVRKYGLETGISAEVNGLCVHSLRATAVTNALSHDSDIAKVQEWLGYANVSTARLYDRRKSKPEDSPTLRVKYLRSPPPCR